VTGRGDAAGGLPDTGAGVLPAARAGTVAVGDLRVPRLGMGTLRLPGVRGPGERRDAVRLLRRAVELGVRLLDTADVYGQGRAEEIIAAALHPYPPGVLIATKGGGSPRRGGAWTPDGSPRHLRAACEASLRRLRLERIDLYQLHVPDPRIPIEESVGALCDLQAEGKIRYVGVSNVTAGELARAQSAAPVVAVQNRFSVAGPDDREVLEVCERHGLAYLPWYPLGCGALARPAGVLARVAARHGATPAQVALAWLLHCSPALLPIPGTGSLEHLEENVAAAGLRLDPEDLAALASA
jgi:aryl-alcohol dehydrogenase-like predicted oxidoreductase